MLKQTLSQKMMQKLSPQQIQLMKLLQIPTINIDQRVKEEIENNPALEEDDENENPTEDNFVTQDNTDTQSGEDGNFENTENTETDEFDEYEENTDNLDLSEYTNDDNEDYQNYDYQPDEPQEDKKTLPIALQKSFHEYLEDQLKTLDFSDDEQLIGIQIIGSIDEDGYLRRSIDALQNDILFAYNIDCDLQQVQNVLNEIQGFDPAGVGARDLQECLLLQIERMPHDTPLIRKAQEVVENYFEQFIKKHYDKIQKSLLLSEEELKQTIHILTHLNPKPGSAFESAAQKEQYIIPDFYVSENEVGVLEVGLNSRNAPDLRVSEHYRSMLKDYEKGSKKDPKQKEAVMFIKQKIDAAKWFIDAIKQRQRTLLLTMEAIFKHQNDFFKSGDETKLKPMILKDIADVTELDISTISRVANSKYVQTEFGVLSLKYFFSESLSTDSGEEVSTREVKKILSDLIGNEQKNKPLSDQKLTKMLQQHGYNIARRTVAKYREQLSLPVARLRKGF